MNSILKFSVLVAAAVVSGTALAANYVKDSFEGVADGTLLSTRSPQWGAPATVVITNMGSKAHSPTNAVLMPVSESMSNTVAAGTTSNIVWSDFWTITRPFQSQEGTAPDLDTSATAQFFVNSNGYWVTMSRAGGAVKTNVITTDVYGTGLSQLPNTGTNWCQISVCHNYSNQSWSLFVEGVPVATNLGFINQGVSNYQWFSVESMGGDPSNTTFLDDLLITNAVPASLTDDQAGGNNGLRDAWELMYYGRLDTGISAASSSVVRADGVTLGQLSAIGTTPFTNNAFPIALEYAFGVSNATVTTMDPTNAGAGMRLAMVVGPDRTNRVVGTSSPTAASAGSFGTSVGSFYTGPGGETNWFVDPTALGRGNRFFYRIVSTSPDGLVTVTNPTTYAWYQQPRIVTGTNYWVGIPVDYGTNNNLNSDLGRHLSLGLRGAAAVGNADWVTVYNPTRNDFALGTDRIWYNVSDAQPADFTIARGHGVYIRSRGLGGAPFGGTVAVFAGAKVTNTTTTVTINPGLNMLTWPYDVATNAWDLTLGATGNNSTDVLLSDRIWFSDGRVVRLWGDLQWRTYPIVTLATNINLNPGDAFFYRSVDGASHPWTPDAP
jgi:hypothetical protein